MSNTRINNLFRQLENLRKQQMSKANSRSPNKKANNGKANIGKRSSNNGSGNKFISIETTARYRAAKEKFPNRSGKIKLRPDTARTTASKKVNNQTRERILAAVRASRYP